MTISNAITTNNYTNSAYFRMQTEKQNPVGSFCDVLNQKIGETKGVEVYVNSSPKLSLELTQAVSEHRVSFEEVSSENLAPERRFLGVTAYAPGKINEQTVVAYEALESTPEDPIVQLTFTVDGEKKTYNVYVNKVNPEDATDMEMFAYLSYYETEGRRLDEAIGNWEAYQMAKIASDLDDYGDGFGTPFDRFTKKKQNAFAIVEDATAKMNELNSRESRKLAALFEQLSILMHSIEDEKKMRASGEATEIVEG